MVADLHRMLYDDHLAALPALVENDFREERQHARSEYRQVGELRAPWFRWAPQKTITDLWNDSRKRRENPEYMRRMRELQKELDDDADKIAAAVKEELELRKRAQEFREQEKQKAARKPIGRRYARVPKKRRQGR